MNATVDRHDRPVERGVGVSMRRERQWGLFGGLVGAVFGIGSALIAVYVEGASWWSSSTPYPQFFAHHRLLTYDYFLVSALLGGSLLIWLWARSAPSACASSIGARPSYW